MKILFIPTVNPNLQGDILEVSILHGLRTVMGPNCIDYPRKKVMYHDWSETPKNTLYGKGFTLYTQPIQDIDRNITEIDVVLYGCGHAYGEPISSQINSLANNNVWYLDGHDLYGDAPKKIFYNGEYIIATQFNNCFKRELVEENLTNVFPTGFGIPHYQIRPFNFKNKTQIFQQTAPPGALFQNYNLPSSTLHIFDNEYDYYKDMEKSWFGLTCKKGGWDCLRHYEIMASGACLLFRDYNNKPPLCSPQNLPCFSYSTLEELNDLVNRLIVNNRPTEEYLAMCLQQRQWLNSYGTTEARAIAILQILNKFILK